MKEIAMLTAKLNTKPWYREPWPWLLMAFPLAAVVAGFITLTLAIQTADGLVATDYYKQGLAINRQLQREQIAASLKLQVEAVIDTERGLVRIHLDGSGSLPGALSLRLVHPTRAGMDQTITLKAAPGGWYEGRLVTPQPAHWQVVLEDVGRTWRLDGSWDTVAHAGMRFPAP
jgi:uncharacterized protein